MLVHEVYWAMRLHRIFTGDQTLMMQCCCRMVLEGPLFAQYFGKVQATNFEVASDAFQTFKELLTRHKPLVGSFLSSHYDEVRFLPTLVQLCLWLPAGIQLRRSSGGNYPILEPSLGPFSAPEISISSHTCLRFKHAD